MNVIILSTPRQFSGISLGAGPLMRIIGAPMSHALAGMYTPTSPIITKYPWIAQYFPSADSFNLIFTIPLYINHVNSASNNTKAKIVKMAIPILSNKEEDISNINIS